MAINLDISVNTLNTGDGNSCHSNLALLPAGLERYLVDNKLYFSAATYPHMNNANAEGNDSCSAVGCKQGTANIL